MIYLIDWLALSRLPFMSVGLLPFILGTALAYKLVRVFDPIVFLLGCAGAFLIMLSTYFAGEYSDQREDALSPPNKFSGGSRVMQQGRIPEAAPLFAALAALLLALLIGFCLQFGLKTGPLTLLLGIIGMIGGFFYSVRPVRWVSSGLGELWIAFCYGWLAVATGYYLQAGSFQPLVHWLSIPIGLTIFNVILLNEFSDYDADRQTGKKNILVRLGGPAGGAKLYGLVGLLSWFAVVATTLAGIKPLFLLIYLPVFVLSAILTRLVLKGPKKLEQLCGLNILVNLGTSLSYLIYLYVQ